MIQDVGTYLIFYASDVKWESYIIIWLSFQYYLICKRYLICMLQFIMKIIYINFRIQTCVITVKQCQEIVFRYLVANSNRYA